MIWKDCVKEPSEIGKKVLCQRRGDFYVAIRVEQYYIPMPFADHYFSIDLCYPEQWMDIPFPDPYTGYVRMAPHGIDSAIVTLAYAKEEFPESYWAFAKPLIDSIGKIPKPKGMK